MKIFEFYYSKKWKYPIDDFVFRIERKWLTIEIVVIDSCKVWNFTLNKKIFWKWMNCLFIMVKSKKGETYDDVI